MSLIEKLEQEYKRTQDDCLIQRESVRKYLENCDLRDTLKEVLDYIRQPVK